jgi:protein phosphatase
MGGHAAGEVASGMAVDVIRDFIASTHGEDEITLPFDVPNDLPYPARRLVASAKLANQKIYEMGRSNPKYNGMGTTMVGLLAEKDAVYVMHAGDSRAYLIRGGAIRRITQDHSLVNEYIVQGLLSEKEASAHPHKHVVTRALGSSPYVEIDVSTVPLRNGDLFLLCTDGLTNPVSDKEICSQVTETRSPLQKISQKLIDLAFKKGADDNITVVLVSYTK